VWQYLKSAFFARVPVPGLGEVPVNILGVTAFAILGFGEPAFWFLGAGLETLFLYLLATNERFQKVVDSGHLHVSEASAEMKRQELIRGLPPELQRRFMAITARCAKAGDAVRGQETDDFTLEANQDALKRLEWVYLKLLVARNNLLSATSSETEDTLRRNIAVIEGELQSGGDSEALRRSKVATVAILKERLANIGRRSDSIEEIDSDLLRIEAQVELMLENATIKGKPQTIATDIELATNLASTTLFGDSGSAVADLDEVYRPRAARREAQRE